MSKPSLREDMETLIKITRNTFGGKSEQNGIRFEEYLAGETITKLTQRIGKCELTDEAIKELCVRYLGWDEPVSDKDLALAKPLFEAQLQKVKEELK